MVISQIIVKNIKDLDDNIRGNAYTLMGTSGKYSFICINA